MAYRPVYYTFTILSMAVLGESKIQISQQGQCPPLTYFYYDPGELRTRNLGLVTLFLIRTSSLSAEAE